MPTVSDLDDMELLARARALLASRPMGEPSGTWAGSGRNELCSVCGVPIGPAEIGFDLLFRTPQCELELHMHSRCRSAWERALQARSC